MTMTSLKAWAFGATTLIVANTVVFIAVRAEMTSLPFDLLLWFSPAMASFLVAYHAPHNKVPLGLSMALPAAILAALINYAQEAAGHTVDFPGLRGGFVLLKAILVWDLALSAVAALAAHRLTRRRTILARRKGG